MTDRPLSASELGNLWQAYREKSMTLRVLEYFLEKCKEQQVKTIVEGIYTTETKNEEMIKG